MTRRFGAGHAQGERQRVVPQSMTLPKNATSGARDRNVSTMRAVSMFADFSVKLCFLFCTTFGGSSREVVVVVKAIAHVHARLAHNGAA